MVVFVTNHSNDDTGDLYIGENLAAPVNYVSVKFFPPGSGLTGDATVHGSSAPRKVELLSFR